MKILCKSTTSDSPNYDVLSSRELGLNVLTGEIHLKIYDVDQSQFRITKHRPIDSLFGLTYNKGHLSVNLVDNLTSYRTDAALTANAGRELAERVSSAVTMVPELNATEIAVNEGSTSIIEITNYFDVIRYDLQYDSNYIDAWVDSGFLYVKAKFVDTDINTTLKIQATAPGLASSFWKEIQVRILNVPIQADQTLTNGSFPNNDEVNSGFSY